MFSQNIARGRMNLNIYFSDNIDILHTLLTIFQAYVIIKGTSSTVFFNLKGVLLKFIIIHFVIISTLPCEYCNQQVII